MKHFSLIALVATRIAFAAPEVVPSPVEHLYIPEGFDSNDAVEVVVTGTFPNPCYSRNDAKVSVTGDLVDIEITALAPEMTRKSTGACPQMLVPFKEVVSVGNLQGGGYKVRVNHGTRYALKDKMAIHEATSSAVDDHVYAAIEYVERKSESAYTLRGWRYSPCFELDEVKVVSNGKDTLSILPIMKQVSDFCPMKGMPVAYDVNLDFSGFKMKKPLLHVRTLDGKSVNTIVNLEGSR